MCEHCTRREFLGTGVAGGIMLAGANWSHAWAGETARARAPQKVKICVLFTGTSGPDDRGWNTDSTQLATMEATLAQAQQEMPNVDLVIGRADNPQQTAAVLKKAGPDVPVLAINLSCFSLMRAAPPILEGGHPLAVFSLPASGHDWMYPYRWQRQGHRVTLLASSDTEEIKRALRLLRTIPLMKQSRVLLFPPARGTTAAQSPDAIREHLGTDVVAVEERRFDEMVAAVTDGDMREEFKRWTGNAKAIVEPNQDDIQKAARISVALQRLMEQECAQALAVGTCMGWLAKGFPCLGFTRLRDAGCPAACEGDMDSLLTMLLFQHAFDRPGFQGNATFDTSRNALWTAHCTAPLKMEGPDGPEAPYLLRGHSEVQGSGCVPEVQYRVGQTVTRTKLVNLDTLLASTGTIIEVPAKSVHGCRTQIVTEVRDAARMAADWSQVLETEDAMTLLHRVVYYGDHLNSVHHLARLMGMKVVEEV